MKRNLAARDMWGGETPPDIESTFRACLGFASAPAWVSIREIVYKTFNGFDGLRAIELGSGLGKVSVLFALLGAGVTLIDYSDAQLAAARMVHDYFDTAAKIKKGNILGLPEMEYADYDIAMSFGTAEHFLQDERQAVFDSHAKVLKTGGLAIVWAPNRYGLLFHLGRAARRIIGRGGIHVEEKSFTRYELRRRASAAGLTDIHIQGGEQLRNDFSNHIFNMQRFSSNKKKLPLFSPDKEVNKEALRHRLKENNTKTRLWGNLFSYPLVLIARRA